MTFTSSSRKTAFTLGRNIFRVNMLKGNTFHLNMFVITLFTLDLFVIRLNKSNQLIPKRVLLRGYQLSVGVHLLIFNFKF